MSEEANAQSVDDLSNFDYLGVKIVAYQSFAIFLGRIADGDTLVI